jgi:hypothetical protein
VIANLVGHIKKGIEQINRVECDKGIVVINLKNILPHDEFINSIFWIWEEAHCAVMAHINGILRELYANEADKLTLLFGERGIIASLIIIIAHTTVLSHATSKKIMFTELKSMVAASMPTPEGPMIGTFGRKAENLASNFNYFVQTIL